MSFMEKLFGNFSDKELKRIKPIANKVLELEPQAHRATAIARTRSSAVIFFIFLISSLKFLM